MTRFPAGTTGTSWWRRLARVGRLERGVFAEIGADRRATWQALGIVVAASLIGGWRFLWPGDGEWHISRWLLEEAGVAVVTSVVAAALLWAITKAAGGSGTVSGLWRGLGFAMAPIALGAFGAIGLLAGIVLEIPLIVRVVGETQKVRTRTAIVAVSVPILLYAAFLVFVVVVLGWK